MHKYKKNAFGSLLRVYSPHMATRTLPLLLIYTRFFLFIK